MKSAFLQNIKNKTTKCPFIPHPKNLDHAKGNQNRQYGKEIFEHISFTIEHPQTSRTRKQNQIYIQLNPILHDLAFAENS